jgi:predicted Zn-dependent peptidase
VVKTAATEQAYVYFGAPYSMPYDSDEAYLGKVASFVLGSSGFGSRLMEEIRVKRGLAYSAYCSFSVNRTGSYFTGHLQTKLESAEEAKSVVLEVVAAFISKGITQEELDAAKQFLIGSEPLRNETLQQRIGNAFNAYYSGKPLDYRTTELRLIEAIELKQINAFIGSHTEIGQLSFAMVKA